MRITDIVGTVKRKARDSRKQDILQLDALNFGLSKVKFMLQKLEKDMVLVQTES